MNYLTEKQLKEIADKEVQTIEMLREAAIDRRKDYDDKTYIDQFLEEQWRDALNKAAFIANARSSLREKFVNKDVIAMIQSDGEITSIGSQLYSNNAISLNIDKHEALKNALKANS